MKQKVTAAIVIIDRDGNILAGHGTGKPDYTGYDFPKGCVEPGEEHIAAAIRELKEETGLTISESDLIDAGVHPHNREKDIHLFICKVNVLPDPSSLVCTSYFETPDGKRLPEMNSFKIISKSERGLFNKVLQNKFDIIDSYNERKDL